MNKQQAVADVVEYHTLPSQIDYTKPYWVKAVEAQRFIDSLPIVEKEECNDEIKSQIESYNTPGECGYSPAELNEMF